MDTNIDDMPPLGPAPEDLETRRLRQEMARTLFGPQAPDLMKIGRFDLIEELGQGGQGTVYEAWDPELDRRVALKRLAVADPNHRARMRQEGRALARVDHPNVVRIYEVGEDETDRPYLVMALVVGIRLDRWLKEAPRHWADVVRLMVSVGDGLAAIHEADVMHRDVKPANIVIEENGNATLIDLGIAVLDITQAVSAPDDAAGTAGYMAPECFGGPADARSDQYGFCVTLYEALCGVRPPLSMTRSESEPSGGSAGLLGGGRLGARAATDQTEPYGRPPVAAIGLEAAPRRLRDVLARGMQDDPERRYHDMSALLAALRAVLPRPRMWPRTSASIGVVLAVGVALGAYSSWSSADPCEVERPAAALWGDQPRQAVRDALTRAAGPDADESFNAVDGMLAQTTAALDARWTEVCGRPQGDDARSMGLAELQSRHGALGAVVDSLAEVEPQNAAELPVRLAGALGRLHTSGPRDACERTEVMLESTPRLDSIEDVVRRAVAQGVAGHYDAALSLATEALGLAEGELLEPVQARLLLERGQLALEGLQTDDALGDLEAARSRAEVLGCNGLGARALTLYAKAQLVEGHGNLDKADLASRLALEKLEQTGFDGPRRAEALKSRGLVLQRQHDYEAATEHYRQALEIWAASEPPAPLDITDAMLNLAVTQARQGQREEAVATLHDAISIREAALWPEHPSLYKLHASLSYRYLEQGELAASETELSRALELAEAGLGSQHPRVATLHIAMARVLDYQHDFSAALRHAIRADEILAQVHGEHDLRRIDALEAVGQVHMNAGSVVQAIPVLTKALEIQSASDEATPWDRVIGRSKLARAHARNGDHPTAIQLYAQAHRELEAIPSRRLDPFVLELLMGWGEALVSAGRPADAVDPLTEAETRWSEDGTNPERLAHTRWWLAQAKCATAPDGAESLAREALRYFESAQTDGARRMRDEIGDWLERGCSVVR